MTPSDAIRALAVRFFDAVEAGDIDMVCDAYAPDAVIWHNTDGLETGREENVRVLSGLIERAGERRYVDRRLQIFGDGFVQQHVLKCVRRKDGYVLELPACVVVSVRDGLIVRLDEYFDAASLPAWFALG